MRTIKLKSNGLGRYDDVSPFIVDSGELFIKFTLPQKVGEFFFVWNIKDMTATETVSIPQSGEITIKCTSAGVLESEVKHYIHGKLVERYKVEPLILCKVDTALSATPEIALLTEEIKALRERTEALEKAREEDNAATKKAFERLTYALLSYSYAEYEDDVQLNAQGLSFEAFAEALGLSTEGLSEEELEEIKNLKEKL